MATPAQILANRENALHSTDPVTSEGKSRSAQNATKHGLTSKAVVLPNESEEEYNEFRDSLVADLEPVGDREITLATVIAETYWRRQRFYRLETAFMTARMKAISEANPEITEGDEALVQNSLGSGVIVTNEGHIITNNHVVTDRQGRPVDQIEVQLADGRTMKARLVGADEQVDLAVLKIDEPNLKPLKLADSDSVQPGDFVLAIGNPLGFEETVTDGIISSKGRPNRSDAFADLLQTNAAINPGNSGGPLINLQGEVIGINTVIASTTGGSQGLGFAIPSNTVRSALESLLKQGRIIRGYLGIQSGPLQRGALGADSGGVTVGDVISGSPAEQAGLQPGDVIESFNGHDVKNFSMLRTLVAQAPLDKQVELQIVRNGKPLTVKTQIKEQPVDYESARVVPRGNQPQQPQQPRVPQQPNDQETVDSPLASIHVDQLTPEKARELDLPPNVQGVLVTDVDPDSGMAELQKDDVIEEINQQPVTSVSDYNKLAASLNPEQPQVLSVCRHRARSFLVLRPR